MKSTTQFFKNHFRSFALMVAFAITFLAGFLFQSFNSSAKNLAQSMTSYVAGAAPASTNATVCGLTAMPGNDAVRGIFVTASDYNTASAAYEAAHPDQPAGSATWGGIIGKEYLIAVINSLSATQNNVSFRFATEANLKTSLYFVGGTNDPVSGKAGSYNLYLKTGSSLDTYCPTHCNN